MIKPFLILQSRPEDEVADNEFEAFLRFGGIDKQNTRRVRLEKEKLPPVTLSDYSAVIVGGGPYCMSDDHKPPEQLRVEEELNGLLERIVADDFPFLGTCYGLSVLAKYLGGAISKERYSETAGAITVKLTKDGQKDPLLSGLPSDFLAFGGHKESCQDIPRRAKLLAKSEACPIHMISVKQNIYATQFHPELEKVGMALRVNFYRHKRYFPPEDADMLIAAANQAEITIPEKILRRFVTRYSTEK